MTERIKQEVVLKKCNNTVISAHTISNKKNSDMKQSPGVGLRLFYTSSSSRLVISFIRFRRTLICRGMSSFFKIRTSISSSSLLISSSLRSTTNESSVAVSTVSAFRETFAIAVSCLRRDDAVYIFWIIVLSRIWNLAMWEYKLSVVCCNTMCYKSLVVVLRKTEPDFTENIA